MKIKILPESKTQKQISPSGYKATYHVEILN